MILLLFKLPWSAFTRGEIYGYPVPQNPIAWIPYFLVLPIITVVYMLIVIGHILLLPLIWVVAYFAIRSFQRKAGVFSGAGIHFPHAYGKLTIAWTEIREVIREREPKAIFYRIVCGIVPENTREYIMTSTPDDDAFVRTLRARGIPFKKHDWFDESESAA